MLYDVFTQEEAFEMMLEETREDSMRIGREDGLNHGLKQGSINTKYQIIKSMLDNGLDIDFISRSINISKEEINEILGSVK